jgi:exosortase/archaeosortase family protein
MFAPGLNSIQPAASRNLYIGAVALTIVFAALFSTSLPGRDLYSAGLHAFINFKLTWICAFIAIWRIWGAPSQDLRSGDVICGGIFVALAAVTAGPWPWIFLCMFAAVLLRGAGQSTERQALYLLVAMGVHEVFVSLCGEVFADSLLSLDALIAGSLTRLLLPDVLVTGTMLQVPGGHSVMLVWGCSSLSYVGDMMLLCWALSLFLAGKSEPGRGLWRWLALVAVITVALNSARLALMAMDPQTYAFLHEGPGAVAFRIIILTGAACVAWLQFYHANSDSDRVA